MGIRRKVIKVNRANAVRITMSHNCVSREIAEAYTDSELREVLRHLRLTPGF